MMDSIILCVHILLPPSFPVDEHKPKLYSVDVVESLVNVY